MNEESFNEERIKMKTFLNDLIYDRYQIHCCFR